MLRHKFVLLFFCSLFLPLSVFCDDFQPENHPGFDRYFSTLAYNLTVGMVSPQNFVPFCVGSFSALTAYGFDSQISEAISPFSDAIGGTGQILGSPLVMGITGGSMLAVPFTKNKKFRAFAFDLSQAFLINNLIVQATKSAVGRTRPNGESDDSFPSGHSSDSFVLAGVMSHYYGKKVGIAAYALAGFVAFSRVEKGKHFPSDVIFGATVGYLSSATVLRSNQRESLKRVSFFPYAAPGSYGLNVVLSL